MRYLKVASCILFTFFVSFVFYLGVFSVPKPISGDNSIAVLKKVELGGMEQWVSIRGEDRNKPILLWLHGGPGMAQMFFAHELDTELEKEFIVVHWDQRGAGKSNTIDFDDSTISTDQLLQDSFELVQYLKESFGREKIYLLGYSWGSKLGINLVDMYPEDFDAFISVSQIVNINEGLDIGYDWLWSEVEKNEDVKDLERLKELGRPPYTQEEYDDYADILIEYGGGLDRTREELALIAMRSPEYNALNYIQWLNGLDKSRRIIWENTEDYDFDYREEITSIDVPIYFFIGLNDYTTPFELVESYFEIIQAPKKELIVFENSAHTPFFGETEKFSRELIGVKD